MTKIIVNNQVPKGFIFIVPPPPFNRIDSDSERLKRFSTTLVARVNKEPKCPKQPID